MTKLSIVTTGSHKPTAQQLEQATSCALLLFHARGFTLNDMALNETDAIQSWAIRRAWRIALKNAKALCGTNEIDMVITRR